MKIYFSHPTFTYNTKTERACKKIINKGLKPEGIIDPSNYGLTADLKELISKTDGVVGIAISGKYTFLVWNEMEYGEENDKDLYTLFVKDKNDIGPLVEGMPEDLKKLSRSESKKFSTEITKGYRDSFFSIFVGNWGRRF
mgnify:CR=1 FL=1